MSQTFLNALFWAAAVCVVVGQVAILHSMFIAVPAARAAGEAPPLTSTGGQRALEMLWAWLPLFGLVLVLFLTWNAVRSPAGVTWKLVVPAVDAAPVVLPRTSAASGAPAASVAFRIQVPAVPHSGQLAVELAEDS